MEKRNSDKRPLPSAGSAPHPRAPMRQRPEPAAGVVLIVEDQEDLRDGLRRFLQLKGYEAHVARNFDAALRAADAKPPDVAVCDRELGESRSGIDVARILQRRYASAIVFVSGTSIEQLRADTADLDVVAYLQKPVSPARIEQSVRDGARSARR